MQPIPGVSTSTAALIGWAPNGPTDRAVLVENWDRYVRLFGGLDARGFFGHCVSHFFANGGERAWIVRIAGADGAALRPGDAPFEAALPGAMKLLEGIDFNLLSVPGEADSAAIARLQAFCAARRAFLIADTARDATFETLKGGPDAAITGDDAAYSALYFPWLLAPDPLQPDRIAEFPPSAAIAGLYAATDLQKGVWRAPAGIDAALKGVTGLRTAVDDAMNGTLNTKAINCVRSLASYGIVIWGARTLRGMDEAHSDWKYVPTRRVMLYIERSIAAGTKWAAFESNDERLWSRVREQVAAFLSSLWQQGALFGAAAADAYSVAVDKSTTTPEDIDNGMFNIFVACAVTAPAEFVVARIAQAALRPPPRGSC